MHPKKIKVPVEVSLDHESYNDFVEVEISFNTSPLSATKIDKLAKKIEDECGIDLIELGEQKYPTFSIREAKDVGFQRFDYKLSLLNDKTKCQMEIFDRFSEKFWYELLHLTGKSLRGTQENGNFGETTQLVGDFSRLQENVKSGFKR